MTAKEVEEILEHRYLEQLTGWVFLREVTMGDPEVIEASREWWKDGWKNKTPMPDIMADAYSRRIDVLLIKRLGGTTPYERIAVEIKVSRADFFRETHAKRRAFNNIAHRFAYCAPVGLIKPEEVPPGCGLLEVNPAGFDAYGWSRVKWKVNAPKRKEQPAAPTEGFWVYLAGRASKAEHELRKEKR